MEPRKKYDAAVREDGLHFLVAHPELPLAEKLALLDKIFPAHCPPAKSYRPEAR